jgi:hypothetical protein
MVPVELAPLTTVAGFIVSVLIVGAVIVKAIEADELLADAVMSAIALAETATVVTVNGAVVAPAGMVTEAGTTALALPDVRAT